MARYEVTGPDGARYEITAPDNASEAQVMAYAQQQFGRQQPARDTSRVRGFVGGLLKPIDNAAEALEGGYNALAGAVGLPQSTSAATAARQNDAMRANNTRNGMEVVGNIVGTAPTLALPGGVMAQGAAGGALLSDARDAGGVLMDAGLGAVAGKVGDMAVRGVQRVIAPKVAPALAKLKAAGQSMTPGQAARATGTRAGEALGRVEDKATSLPFVGNMIASDRANNLERFSVTAINEALKPIGVRVPAKATPQEAVAYAQRATSAAYERAASRMTAKMDQPFADAIRRAQDAATDGTLAEPQAKQLEQILTQRLARYFDPATGEISGKNFVGAFRSLRDLAGKYARSGDASQQELGRVLGEVFDGLQDSAMRNSGQQVSGAFQKAREAYGNRVVIERAAASAANANGRAPGAFTPGQMIGAIRQSDGTARKAATARGQGRMQGFASDAQAALTSTVGDSGTGPRMSQANLPAMLLGAAGVPVYGAARLAQPLVTRQAGPTAQRAANALTPLRRAGAAVGPALLLRPDE